MWPQAQEEASFPALHVQSLTEFALYLQHSQGCVLAKKASGLATPTPTAPAPPNRSHFSFTGYWEKIDSKTIHHIQMASEDY